MWKESLTIGKAQVVVAVAMELEKAKVVVVGAIVACDETGYEGIFTVNNWCPETLTDIALPKSLEQSLILFLLKVFAITGIDWGAGWSCCCDWTTMEETWDSIEPAAVPVDIISVVANGNRGVDVGVAAIVTAIGREICGAVLILKSWKLMTKSEWHDTYTPLT